MSKSECQLSHEELKTIDTLIQAMEKDKKPIITEFLGHILSQIIHTPTHVACHLLGLTKMQPEDQLIALMSKLDKEGEINSDHVTLDELKAIRQKYLK